MSLRLGRASARFWKRRQVHLGGGPVHQGIGALGLDEPEAHGLHGLVVAVQGQGSASRVPLPLTGEALQHRILGALACQGAPLRLGFGEQPIDLKGGSVEESAGEPLRGPCPQAIEHQAAGWVQ